MEHRSYIRLDERDDVIASIELCSFLAPELTRKPLFWKWVLIGAHNALYGSLVCALSGTAGVGALTPNSRKKMLDYLQSGNGSYPKERLADFPTLLKWAQQKDRMSYLGGQPLALTDTERKDLSRLNELRRNLVHFSPKGWSIEEAGLSRIVLTAALFSEKLMFEHPTIVLHLSAAQKSRLRRSFKALKSKFGDASKSKTSKKDSVS